MTNPKLSPADRLLGLERRIQLEEQKLLNEISRLATGMRAGPMRSHELEDVRRHLRIIAKELEG